MPHLKSLFARMASHAKKRNITDADMGVEKLEACEADMENGLGFLEEKKKKKKPRTDLG